MNAPAPFDADAVAADLTARWAGLEADMLLEAALGAFPGEIALVSSFGAESAVLLHMAARIDRATPVIFLNTGKLFGETLRYRTRLVELLGLTDVREVKPHEADLVRVDPEGTLWVRSPDTCCHVRKTLPLERALTGMRAWITGRKRFQGGGREALPAVEAADGRVKVNPLAGWNRDRLQAYFDAAGLPRHPLEADGYLSIGCMPCTDRVAPGEDFRAGRWRGQEKTECGIHLPSTTKQKSVGAS